MGCRARVLISAGRRGQPWSLRGAAGLFRTVADGLVTARRRTKLRLRLGCVASV
jgi:hypothetical protein